MSDTPTTHTPWPWVVMDTPAPSREDHGWRAICVIGQRMVAVTKEQMWRGAESRSALSAGLERDANAHLIAAAPELLDALILARKTLLVACGTDAPYIRTALKPIDAAIAKATGVQPLNNGDAK